MGEWSAARPGRILTPGKTRYPFYRRLGGPQGWSGRVENLVPTGIFFFLSFWKYLLYFQTYTQELNITSASCFGSSFPIPFHLILILAQPHSSGVGGVPLPAPWTILTTVSSILAFSHLLGDCVSRSTTFTYVRASDPLYALFSLVFVLLDCSMGVGVLISSTG